MVVVRLVACVPFGRKALIRGATEMPVSGAYQDLVLCFLFCYLRKYVCQGGALTI